MNIDMDYKKKVLFINVNESLIKKDVSNFESLVIPVILELKCRDITINLNIDSIDKYGINSIIKICNIENKFDGNVFINKINNNIRKLLTESNLYDYCIHNERENIYEL